MAQPRAMHAGMVTTHATTMCPAIPQRTADKRLVAPTPRIAEEMTWVVETGIPKRLATSMMAAAAVSAAKPLIGRNSTTLSPIVLTMRQHPIDVPRPIEVAAARINHKGTPHGLPAQP